MATVQSSAVDAALKADWDSAIILNRKLLKENPNDIETLNRIAYAFMENGKLDEAKKYYHRVLKLDRHNPIAEKNLKKITTLQEKRGAISRNVPSGKSKTNQRAVDEISDIFLEEPGRTKITKLLNLAEPHVLSTLRPAVAVTLLIKRHSIFVKLPDGTYIGALPDDIAYRLIPFIRGGNQYSSYIKSVDKNSISILIKEIKRGTRFKHSPSFVSNTSTYPSFIHEDAIKEERRPDVSTYEDLEEEPSPEKEDDSEKS